MERSTIFDRKTMGKPWENGDLYGKIHHFIARLGKPSISMGHLYHGELLNNQRLTAIYIYI